MKITIIEWLIGVFAIDEENKIIDTVFFPRNGEKMMDTIIKVQKGKIVEEVAKIVRDLNHNPQVAPEEGIKKTVEWMKHHYRIKW